MHKAYYVRDKHTLIRKWQRCEPDRCHCKVQSCHLHLRKTSSACQMELKNKFRKDINSNGAEYRSGALYHCKIITAYSKIVLRKLTRRKLHKLQLRLNS